MKLRRGRLAALAILALSLPGLRAFAQTEGGSDEQPEAKPPKAEPTAPAEPTETLPPAPLPVATPGTTLYIPPPVPPLRVENSSASIQIGVLGQPAFEMAGAPDAEKTTKNLVPAPYSPDGRRYALQDHRDFTSTRTGQTSSSWTVRRRWRSSDKYASRPHRPGRLYDVEAPRVLRAETTRWIDIKHRRRVHAAGRSPTTASRARRSSTARITSSTPSAAASRATPIRSTQRPGRAR